MKNRLFKTQIVLATALAFSIISCDSKKSDEHQQTEETVNAEKKINTDSDQQTSIDQEQVNQLFGAYIEVKNALVETDAEMAKTKAKVLANSIDANMENALQTIADIANKIADNENIEDQRVKFEELSKKVYEIVKASAISATIYKQYCPMAFNNKGAFWLSTEEQVLNPYFGDKMLKCGMVQETIAAN